MKCPLFGAEYTRAANYVHMEKGDCLQEECAWWEREGEGCAMPLIALRLGTIAEVLDEIEKKMPRNRILGKKVF